MAWFDGDEGSATRGANLSARHEFGFDDGAIIPRFDETCGEQHGRVCRRRAQEFHGVFSRDSAGRRIRLCASHEMPRGCPVGVAIYERADDAAVQHARVRLVMRLRSPLAYHFVAARKTSYAQTEFVGRPAPVATQLRRVSLL